MSIKPWREIAKPHKDVLEGTFKQSEFAADISAVAAGKASDEYQDAEMFFSRTYITEGMRLLLLSVVQRLAGKGGDPVIQLQTAFGGGKTHTMLAVLHMASRNVDISELRGIPEILKEAGVEDIPKANIAIIDGIKLSPSQPVKHKGIATNTLWGELAMQLSGEDGYALVANSDNDGTSPGKEVLSQLIKNAAPCVILIDELVAYIRQFEPGKQYKGGTYDSNLSFIQALTEAVKTVPNAILLASLPESDLEAGGEVGQRALNTLEKFFARLEAVWKPVGAEEAFEIVRRRLFDKVGSAKEMDGVCQVFADYYRQHPDKLPIETQANSYRDRLRQSYPIHPEIFDRLYEDWSTLDKFQRTRGVLQYLAIIIHRLWNSENRDPLIMPGSIPLDDATVRNKSIHYLPQGWEPVIESEVDGPKSEPFELDGKDTRFGSVQAARRVARTIFLGSAPAAANALVKGIKLERVLLGCAQPTQSLGVYEDVLGRLRDHLHYLYVDHDQFWFDTKPNLRREMEGRKKNVSEVDALLPLLKTRIGKIFGQNHHFTGIHVFTPSGDVPDDFGTGPRLVLLSPDVAYSRNETRLCYEAAEEILKNRGDQPRQKQNRLIFLAADFETVSRLKDQGRTYLAWFEIIQDIDDEKIILDTYQVRQAKRYCDGAEQNLKQLLRECYKWLMCPVEEFVKGKPVLKWEVVSVSPAAANIMSEIENRLREEEWLIFEWSPIHLRNMLKQWYFKDSAHEVNALKVWQDCCNYLYLPRMVNDHVFKNAISEGVASEDYFGFASGKEDDQYLGFVFSKPALINIDDSSLLIERAKAADYWNKIKPQPLTITSTGGDITTTGTLGGDKGANGNGATAGEKTANGGVKKQFYGTVTLDPVKAKLDFATIVDEVVQNFTQKPGIDVKISIDIQAKAPKGFDSNFQRTIKENCKTLKFSNSEFEDSDD